jgi:hypothetical protein
LSDLLLTPSEHIPWRGQAALLEAAEDVLRTCTDDSAVRVLALLLHSTRLLPAAAAAATATLSRCSRLSNERSTDGQTGLLLLLRACAALPDAAAGVLTLVGNAAAARRRKACPVQPVRKPLTLPSPPRPTSQCTAW